MIIAKILIDTNIRKKIRAYGYGVAIKHYFTVKISYLDAYTQLSYIEYKRKKGLILMSSLSLDEWMVG
jgi:hypothetical protein